MQTPEFSRPVDVSSLEDGATERRTIAATPEECEALARRFGAASLEGLDAEVALTRRGRQLRVEIRFSAKVVQTCVVTLEPVRSVMNQSFSMVFDPDVRATGEFDEPLGVADDDPPEPLRDETIDAGEAVAEMFGLALDPWPRKPGARLDARYTAREPFETSPFSVLKTRD